MEIKEGRASKKIWRALEDKLWAQILIGLGLGVLFGLLLGPDLELVSREFATQAASWIAIVGHFFLAVIKMVVVPLVVASVVCGIAASENVALIRSLGVRVIFYFLFTTFIAVSIGATLVTLTSPGVGMEQFASSTIQGYTAPEVSAMLLDDTNIPKRIVGLIPSNPFSAMSTGEMLQIVIFSAILGAALLVMPVEKSRPLTTLAVSVQEACMVVVGWILKLAPYAIFGLILEVVARTGMSALTTMAFYMANVIGGLLLMAGVYCLILIFVSGRKVGEFFKSIKEAQIIAFSTSSSSATMPVTLKVAEDKVKISPDVSRFVVPLGTTINMDGTALYQTVAALFLAQAFGIDVGVWGMLGILITAIAASVGTPGAPGVGIVVLASILSVLGVPAEGIAILIGVDRILDMCRTTLNVTGDLVACTVMEKWIKKKGKKA